MAGAGRERNARVTAPPGTTFEYKFTLGSWDREALTPSGTVPPNNRLLLDRDTVVVHELAAFKRDPRDYIADWRGSGVRGRLVYWTDVPSAFLGPTRHVEIWLPPGYDDAPAIRYPVLYMHDGQNLFDPRIANTGVDWGVDETVVRLTDRRIIPPIIVVGVWSTAARGLEYSPWHDGADYARFLIEELMPRVNREFRTRTGPANTGVVGSSMGGSCRIIWSPTTRTSSVHAAACPLTSHFRKQWRRRSFQTSLRRGSRTRRRMSSVTSVPACGFREELDTGSTTAAWGSTPLTRQPTGQCAPGSSGRAWSRAGTS
jgi:hypothetical protein